eukprot:2169452-Rhodomonas_salina.1
MQPLVPLGPTGGNLCRHAAGPAVQVASPPSKITMQCTTLGEHVLLPACFPPDLAAASASGSRGPPASASARPGTHTTAEAVLAETAGGSCTAPGARPGLADRGPDTAGTAAGTAAGGGHAVAPVGPAIAAGTMAARDPAAWARDLAAGGTAGTAGTALGGSLGRWERRPREGAAEAEAEAGGEGAQTCPDRPPGSAATSVLDSASGCVGNTGHR